MSEWVIDVRDAEFQSAVVDRSRSLPVIVDFWAPWCGPCRTLGPQIERLAGEYDGRFLLARVNVDESPQIANAFRIQSIPRLIAFKEGRPMLDLVGAVPVNELRRFIDRVVPSPAEVAAIEGETWALDGRQTEAESAFARAVELDPSCGRALLGLARLRAARGEDVAAEQLLERISVADESRAAADRLAAEIRLRRAGAGDREALAARVEADPADLQARFDLAQALAAVADYEGALAQLLEITRRDRGFAEGAPRKQMLDIFEVLGPASELADSFRSELAKILFS